MTMHLWTCEHCKVQLGRHEPAKMFMEPGGKPHFFHNNAVCFSAWREKMLLKELTQIEHHLKERVDTLNDHENWET